MAQDTSADNGLGVISYETYEDTTASPGCCRAVPRGLITLVCALKTLLTNTEGSLRWKWSPPAGDRMDLPYIKERVGLSKDSVMHDILRVSFAFVSDSRAQIKLSSSSCDSHALVPRQCGLFNPV